MPGDRLTAWLRPLLTLAALAGVLSLAACGGGNGAPNNPYQGGTGPLTVQPSTATAYSGVPFVFAVTGGTRPYAVVSSDQVALPVAQALDDNNLVVVPGNVGTDTAVTLTVRDVTGQSVSAAVTVRPNLLLPSSITITGNPNCGASGADLCSGQDGSASVLVLGPAGAPLAGRPVKFDVVQGDFLLSSTAPGQPNVTSLTVNTDQNGNAAVRIVVPTGATTQVATIRATDVTGGSSVVGQFTIAQFVNGNSVLTVLPTGVTTFTGPDTEHCSSGASATWYVFGGTPPYTVTTNFPGAVSVSGSPVLRSGGGFTVTTNGTCFTNMTIIVTDATGRVLTTAPTASNVVGTAAPPPPPLVLTPSSLSATCSAGSTFSFLATGGTGTYSAAVNPEAGVTGDTPTVTAPSSGSSSSATTGGTITISFRSAIAGGVGATGVFDITVSSGTQVKTLKLTCS